MPEAPISPASTNPAPQTESNAPVSNETPAPEGSQQPVAASPTPAEVKAAEKQLKKLQIKFNGKAENIEFDPNDDDYLSKQFQLARLGQVKAQEFSQLKREVENFVAELRKNPSKVLSDPNIGIDLKKLAAEVVQQEIENSKKSPEQLAKEKLEAELKALKDEREREKAEFQQKEFQRLTEQSVATYDQQISEAIESSDLPKKPYVIKKMADYLLLGLENGMDLSAQDVYPLVREEILDDIKQMVDVMPEDTVEKLFGKEIFKKNRRKNVAKAKEAQNPLKSVQDTGKTGKMPEKQAKKQTFREFFGV